MVARSALLVLALVAVAAPALAAHSVTKDYAVGNGPFAASVLGVNVGGATFLAVPGEAPTEVVLDDASGSAAPFFVCQSTDGDRECGEAHEPAVIACGSAPLAVAEFPFVATQHTVVFVGAVALWCPGETGTAGTITVRYG